MKTPSSLLCGLPNMISMLPEILVTNPNIHIATVNQRKSGGTSISGDLVFEKYLEEVKPDLCVFLSPYKGMLGDLSLCLEKGLHIITSGPVPHADKSFQQLVDIVKTNKARWEIRDDFMLDPYQEKLHQAIEETDFGLLVYYREITFGGPSLLSNWWRLCQLYDKAKALFKSEIVETHVSANRQRNKIQLSLTLKSANRANGHIICTNSSYKSDGDLLLIGTGGVMTYEGLHNGPGIFTKRGYQPIPSDPHLPIMSWWDKIIGEETPASEALPSPKRMGIHNDILRAIIRSIKDKRIIKIKPG